jgi:hypothetical protein
MKDAQFACATILLSIAHIHAKFDHTSFRVVQSQKGVGLFFMIRWKNVVTFHSIE